MLEEIMRHIRNYFATDTCYEGEITITDGELNLPFITDGKYFLIEGSLLNDGVYQSPEEGLDDETFTGCVTLLAPPKKFLSLCSDIESFQQDNGGASNYISESFGGYSYTRATNSNGTVTGWQGAFRERLNEWRKV